jgi:HEPN domain-containing protein
VEKIDHIKYWKTTAARDWKRVNLLFKNRDYVFALFCAHLTLEKLIKGHWVKNNEGNFPPKIHNLVRLAEHISLKFSEEETDFLRQMNTFQLEGRYPDYQQALNKTYKAAATKKIVEKSNQIRKCLLKKLP